MYSLNYIFYYSKEEYAKIVDYCKQNNYTIKEILPDEKGRRFQITNIPNPTVEEILEDIRNRRDSECFSYINRGELWYNRLTEEQKQELQTWYQAWLDVTKETNKNEDGKYIIPTKPTWLK